MEIKFYGYKDELSNMYPVTLHIDGKKFNCVEQYFHYCKFKDTDPKYQQRILEQISGYEQRKLGKSREHKIDPNWDNNRMKVMYKAIYHKFYDDEYLRTYLIQTGDQDLIEANPYDNFWGIGNGNGKNMVGKIIMEIRELIMEEYDGLSNW